MTCEDVRNLTPVEQAYWSKHLNLTREQRAQIRQACYGDVRITTEKDAVKLEGLGEFLTARASAKIADFERLEELILCRLRATR